MKEKLRRRYKKKCLHCKCLYLPSKYNWDRQLYCTKNECQSARKKKSQKKWSSKKENKDYFKGENCVKKTQEWRKQNPGYWKHDKKQTPLQDVAFSQSTENKQDVDINNSGEKSALQDLANSQLYLVMGLIAHLTGDALQDSVVKSMRSFIFKGQSLWDLKNETKGGCNEKRNYSKRKSEKISSSV